MKIRVDIDKTVALMAGLDQHGLQVVEIPAADLTDRQRRTLALFASPGNSDRAPAADFYLDRAPSQGTSRSSDDPFYRDSWALAKLLSRADVECVLRLIDATADVLDADEARKKAKAEAQRAEHEAKVAEILASDVDKFLRRSSADTFSDKVGDQYVQTMKWAVDTCGWPKDSRLEPALEQLEATRERWNAETLALEHRPKVEAAQAEARARAEARAEWNREKASWAAAHGSDQLKRSIARGHDCLRLYVEERAGLEYPGFAVDFDNLMGWKSRSCPSSAALDLAEATPGSEIVWITEWPVADLEDFDGVEGVVVRDFLGRYDLARLVGGDGEAR